MHTIYVVHVIQFCPPYKDSISQKQGLCHIKHLLTTYSQLCLGLILLCKDLDYIKLFSTAGNLHSYLGNLDNDQSSSYSEHVSSCSFVIAL